MSHIIKIVSVLALLFGSVGVSSLEAASKSSSSRILPKKSECSMLQADDAYLSNLNGCYSHVAFYDKGGPLKHDLLVITILNDTKNPSRNGKQFISYGDKNKELSVTKNWSIENIDGVIYTCFSHDICFTYSTDFSQVMLIKK